MHTPRTMITFKSAEMRFSYRVGGILIQHEHLLCQAAHTDNFWLLPGGRAELGELAASALLREMQEELGVVVKVERLLYIVENLFTNIEGSKHEIGLYFLLTAPAESYLYQSLASFKHVDEAGDCLHFDWLPIAQLATFPLYPTILQKALQELPSHPVHLEQHNNFDIRSY